MPIRDGTGPLGMGPMTGRGTGFCKTKRFPYFQYKQLFRRFHRFKKSRRRYFRSSLLLGYGYLFYRWLHSKKLNNK